VSATRSRVSWHCGSFRASRVMYTFAVCNCGAIIRTLIATFRTLIATIRTLIATIRTLIVIIPTLIATFRTLIATIRTLIATIRTLIVIIPTLIATARTLIAISPTLIVRGYPHRYSDRGTERLQLTAERPQRRVYGCDGDRKAAHCPRVCVCAYRTYPYRSIDRCVRVDVCARACACAACVRACVPNSG
jgi:hypothetical protein